MAFPTSQLRNFYRRFLLYEEDGITFWVEFQPFKKVSIKFLIIEVNEEILEFPTDLPEESFNVAMNAIDQFNLRLRLKRRNQS